MVSYRWDEGGGKKREQRAMQRISQSKDSEERHIVFLLTFTERWSAAASCQQDSLWGFLEPLPGLKWFTEAGVRVLTVHELELTESLFSQQVHFYRVCLCVYVSGKEAGDSGLNKTRWALGGRDETASVQMNTEAKFSSSSTLWTSTKLTGKLTQKR